MDNVIDEPQAPDATATAEAGREPGLAKVAISPLASRQTPAVHGEDRRWGALGARARTPKFKNVGGSQAKGIKAGVVAKYHGTCLINGNHRPGSEAERECPLRNAAARSTRSKKAAQTRKERRDHLVQGKEPDRAEKG